MLRREFFGFAAVAVFHDPLRYFLRKLVREATRLPWQEYRNVAAMTTAHKTTGLINPAMVHFQAFDSDGWVSGVVQPTHPADYDYRWTFDDVDGSTWALSGKSKNVAYGHDQFHSFPAAGTYDVVLDVIKTDLTVVLYTQTLVVADADLTFDTEGTNDLYFDATLGNDTTGDGTIATPYASVAKAITLWGAGKRFNFKYGETFNNTSGHTLTHNTGPIHMRAYGTPGTRDARGLADNAPIVKKTSDGGQFFIVSGGAGEKNWTFFDLNIQGDAADALACNIFETNFPITRISEFALWRVEVSLAKEGIVFNPVDGSAYIAANEHQLIFMADCYFHEFEVKPFVIPAQKLVCAGSRYRASNSSHIMRISFSRHAVIRDCEASECGGSLHVLKFHSGPNGSGWPDAAYYLIQDCWVHNGNSSAPVSFGPQDDSSDERIDSWVIENCLFTTDDAATVYGMQVRGQNHVIRNCVIDLSGGSVSSVTGIYISKRGSEPAPVDIQIYNCTIFADQNTTFGEFGIHISNDNTPVPDGTIVKNVAVNFTGNHATKELVRDQGTNSVLATNTLNPATPGFTNTATSDFTLTALSDFLDAGTDLGVLVARDRADGYRLGLDYDQGAYERNAGVHPEGGGEPPAGESSYAVRIAWYD
jgi:hypothetical protein